MTALTWQPEGKRKVGRPKTPGLRPHGEGQLRKRKDLDGKHGM